jgi:hypothetical protein
MPGQSGKFAGAGIGAWLLLAAVLVLSAGTAAAVAVVEPPAANRPAAPVDAERTTPLKERKRLWQRLSDCCNGWCAIALGDNKKYGFGWGADRAVAERYALTSSQKETSNAKVVFSINSREMRTWGAIAYDIERSLWLRHRRGTLLAAARDQLYQRHEREGDRCQIRLLVGSGRGRRKDCLRLRLRRQPR